MRPVLSLATAFLSLLLVQSSKADDGVHCDAGLSAVCPLAQFVNKQPVNVMQGLRNAMYNSDAPLSTHYNNGDHIICVSSALSINIGVGVGNAVAGAYLNSGGLIGSGGVCVFVEDTANGVSLSQAKTMIDDILRHGCVTCGLIYPDPSHSKSSDAKLKVDYVHNPNCIDNCLNTENPTRPRGSTSTVIQQTTAAASTPRATQQATTIASQASQQTSQRATAASSPAAASVASPSSQSPQQTAAGGVTTMIAQASQAVQSTAAASRTSLASRYTPGHHIVALVLVSAFFMTL